MKRVSGKVAIVTGSGAGLGEAQAKRLSEEGAAVVVTDIDTTGGERVAEDIRQNGGRATYVRQDVCDPDVWGEVITRTVETFGSFDILVNNAGFAPAQNFESVTLEDWRKVTAVNLDGVYLGTQAAINWMKGNGGGSIVNISSIVGLIGEPATPAYCAAKGGMRLYTKAAALHCARQGYAIRVNSVHPGYIRTPLLEQAAKMTGDVEAFLAQAAAMHPIGRLGEPEEIANGVLFLASDEASFVTGTELVIDGGYTAQ